MWKSSGNSQAMFVIQSWSPEAMQAPSNMCCYPKTLLIRSVCVLDGLKLRTYFKIKNIIFNRSFLEILCTFLPHFYLPPLRILCAGGCWDRKVLDHVLYCTCTKANHKVPMACMAILSGKTVSIKVSIKLVLSIWTIQNY
jgi:hypothetical protein